MAGLFGESFDIKINTKPEVKTLIKKISESSGAAETQDVEKVLKSKTVSLIDRLAIIKEKVLATLGKQKKNVLVIKDRETLHNYISNCITTGRIDIDTETNNSLDPVTCKLMGPCFYAPGLKQAYIPLNHVNPITKERLPWQLTEQDIQEELQRVKDSKILVIMHNGKFDYEVLKCTCNISIAPDWDTIIAARLIDENEFSEKRTSLKYIYTKYIDPSQAKYDIEDLFTNVPYAVVDPDTFALYAATDAMMTDKVYLMQKPIMDAPENSKIKWVFENIEMPIVIVTAEMELTGVAVDTDFGAKLKLKYDKQLADLDTKINNQMAALKVLIQFWKTLPSANQKTRVYQPKKTKLTLEQIEERYPLFDTETGKRYKIGGKCRAEQIGDEVSLSSPVQLAILFYDILQCQPVSKKAPRGTGETELKALADKLKNPEKQINAVISKIFAEISDLRANKLNTSYIDELEEAPVKTVEKDKEMSLFGNTDLNDFELDEDESDQEAIEDNFNTNNSVSIKISPTMTDAEVTALMTELKALYSTSMKAAQALCQAILDRRGIVKLVSTYIDVIPELTKHWPDGRIRFHLNSMGTDTGRYSSGGKLKFIENDQPVVVSGINIQNIPSHNKEIRMLFKAKVDTNNIELTDNYYELPEISEIETDNGWKFGSDLIIGDKIITSEGVDIISNILYKDKKYYLYI